MIPMTANAMPATKKRRQQGGDVPWRHRHRVGCSTMAEVALSRRSQGCWARMAMVWEWNLEPESESESDSDSDLPPEAVQAACASTGDDVGSSTCKRQIAL